MNLEAIVSIIFGYGFFIWGGSVAVRKSILLNRAKLWPSVSGRILESRLFLNDKDQTHFKVRFEFMIGEKIISETARLAGNWFLTNKNQEDFVARFHEGQVVEVFYDPRNPKLNCVDRDDWSGVKALWLLSLGSFILASILVFMMITE